MIFIMATHRWLAVCLALALGAGAAPRVGRAARLSDSPPSARTSRFELARFELTIVPFDRFVVGSQEWRTAWPRLRDAGPPLLTVDGSEVIAYDWQRQTLTFDAAVTRRLAAVLATMTDRPERVRKLKALWRPLDLWSALDGRGFVVRLDGRPLYGGLLCDTSPSLAYAIPLAHPSLDAFGRIVLSIEPGAYPRSWEPRDERDMASVRQRIADPRVRALFAALPAVAPPAGAPAEPPIAPPSGLALNLTRHYHSSGPTDWSLLLDFTADEAVAEIGLRWVGDGGGDGGGDGAFDWFLPDENLTARDVPGERVRPGPQSVEVVLVDWSGRRTAPMPFTVDFAAEMLAWAKYDLLQHDNGWATFHPEKRCDGPCLSFGRAFRHRDALREIRYSLDGCALDRTFPFEPWTDLGHDPEYRWEDVTSVAVPAATASACVQLVYDDGETSAVRTFHRALPASSWDDGALAPPTEAGRDEREALAGVTPPLSMRVEGRSELWFDVPDVTLLADILVRIEGEEGWRSTGPYPRTSPWTGRRHPATSLTVHSPLVTPGRRRVEVRLVDLAGAESGPYGFWFDPQREVIDGAKQRWADEERSWTSLERSRAGDEVCLSFPPSELDGLRAIRYSFDGCALDHTFTWTPWNDLLSSPHACERSEVCVPDPVASACVQLVYRDGEVSAPRRFDVEPP